MYPAIFCTTIIASASTEFAYISLLNNVKRTTINLQIEFELLNARSSFLIRMQVLTESKHCTFNVPNDCLYAKPIVYFLHSYHQLMFTVVNQYMKLFTFCTNIFCIRNTCNY